MTEKKQYPYGVRLYVVRDRVTDEFGNLMEISDYNNPADLETILNHTPSIRYYKKGIETHPFPEDTELLYLGWLDKERPSNNNLLLYPELVIRGNSWQSVVEKVKQNPTEPTIPVGAA